MTQAVNHHNTTNLSGDELATKDASAGSQQTKIVAIMQALTNAVEWWTRDALNREYARRHGRRLKDQSISRALSNLTAVWCPDCKEPWRHFDQWCPSCGSTNEPKQGELQKSDRAMFRSEEDDRVHAWRLAPNPGQADLFGSSVSSQDGLQ